MASTRATSHGDEQRLISGRYRVEQPLASGGMGSVLQVWDQVSERRVALKRLRAGASARQFALFQREFYTLSSLRDPHAVEVYDYGVDTDGPYYTMELLAGHDLRGCAPLPWPEACRMLCQVAHVLGLLHARRLLHRDVSPQNLWRGSDGSVKLIDFGALSSFGVAADVAGTAPAVPPEALYAQPLDERSDLYGLGVLGYWLLTGVQPYPARTFADLTRAWRRPLPSVAARHAALRRADLPEVPARLDALIESLLSQNPMGRPASTAELIDRLDAIAGFEPSGREVVAACSLPRSAFVGRARPREQLQTRLKYADKQRGSSIVFESAPGMGRTRLLQELALDARLAGASVLEACAGEHLGGYGVARALALALLDALPDAAARAAAPHAAVLAHLSPAVQARVGRDVTPLAVANPNESRVRLQMALHAWFLEVARDHRLVIAIDDLQCVDDASAAWLAALVADASRHRLVLVTSLSDDAQPRLGAAVQRFRQASSVSRIDPLPADEMHELLRSVFGDVTHLPRLSARLHDLSQGCPAHTLELAEHLVRTEVIRYAHGSWAIPLDVLVVRLPATRYATLDKRLERLPPSAYALGQVLSIQAGCFPIEACTALFERDAQLAFYDLEALVREGVLASTPEGYKFSHPHLRARLLEELDEPRRRRAHARLGELLLSRPHPSAVDRLCAGVHLLRGGASQRGAELVARATLELGGPDSDADVMPVLEDALELFRRAGHRRHELITLVSRLAPASYFGDRRFADRYGEETLALLQDVLGLNTAQRLRPLLGRKLSLFCGLAWGAVGFALRRSNPLVPSFRRTMAMLLEAATALAGIHVISVDPKAASRCAQVLEPLTALGANHVASFVYEFCLALSLTPRDRPDTSRQHWQRVIERLQGDRPIKGLRPDVRKRYLGGALYACGVLEALRDESRAPWFAEQLEMLDITLYAMSADQIRMVYYGNRGKLSLFEQYRRRVEKYAIQRGSAWQVETWAPGASITLHLRTDNVLGMKRALDELEGLRRDLPSFDVLVQRAVGGYLLLRGQPDEALAKLSCCLLEEPLGVIGWARAHGTLARAHNLLGEPARAREVCLRALEHVTPGDLAFTALNLTLEIELALAEAGLGEFEPALHRLDLLIDRYGSNQGPLTMGALHEARARVSLAQGDEAGFAEHLRHARAWYLPTAIPTLTQRCDRLAREGRMGREPPPVSGQVALDGNTDLDALFSEVSSVQDCAETVLSVLATSTGSDEAYLFLKGSEGLDLAAKTSAAEVPPELVWWVSECLGQITPGHGPDADGRTSSVARSDTLALASKHYRLVKLHTPGHVDGSVLGAAVLAAQDGATATPDENALRALEARLFKAQQQQRSTAS